MICVPLACAAVLDSTVGYNELRARVIISFFINRGRRSITALAAAPSGPIRGMAGKSRPIYDTRWRWRRERDLNPRYGFPHTHFPGVRLQPLGHPSAFSLKDRTDVLFAFSRNARRCGASRKSAHYSVPCGERNRGSPCRLACRVLLICAMTEAISICRRRIARDRRPTPDIGASPRCNAA